MTNSLRSWLTISDIHLGARSTTAKEILSHLEHFFDGFTAKSQFCSVDAIFIAGDLWDDTIEFSSDVLKLFIPFARRFLGWCARNKIAVRVLEGTPRHDRKQSSTFSEIASLVDSTLDFKYVPVLSIEYLEALRMHVLYVPDECRPTADAIAEDVSDLLYTHKLDKVDIAIMHGMFKYQMGQIPMNNKVHDEQWYLERVKYYINIGHVHTHSQYDRIVAQGSFDRLRHGEEEAKGALLVKEITPGEFAHFFIENTLAKVYKTIEVKGSVDAVLKKLDKEIKLLPENSHVRIKGEATHAIFQGFETLRTKYPFYTFTKKLVTEESEKKVVETQNNDYVPVILNRETLTEAVFKEVTSTSVLDPEDEVKLFNLLETFHD